MSNLELKPLIWSRESLCMELNLIVLVERKIVHISQVSNNKYLNISKHIHIGNSEKALFRLWWLNLYHRKSNRDCYVIASH